MRTFRKPGSGRAERLRSAVREVYSAAAEAPAAEHPFPVGQDFARNLGYSAGDLAVIPAIAGEAFTGVSNVPIVSELRAGATVLDLGCGAGVDSLIAARRVGGKGKVIGVDFSAAMLRRAQRASAMIGARNVVFCLADAENLPLKTGAIDTAIVNGIFNLNPAREEIFRELARVICVGGSVYAAELILREPLPPEICDSEENWFA